MGAWIETVRSKKLSEWSRVAPYVGAWIETIKSSANRWYIVESHPMWVRGLKLR